MDFTERFENTIFYGTVADYRHNSNSLRVIYDNGDIIEFYPNEQWLMNKEENQMDLIGYRKTMMDSRR